MTPEEKHHNAEAAAVALLLLARRSRHTLALALLGGARGSAALPLPEARDEVEARLGVAVGAARLSAQKLALGAFERQTGEKLLPSGHPVGTGYPAAGSLADQWAARVGSSEGEATGGTTGRYELAARDLVWACARTANQEVFAEHAAESRAAWESLESRGLSHLWVRVWKAQLEACPRCAPLDETEADSLGEFPDGDPQLHIGCLCYVVLEPR